MLNKCIYIEIIILLSSLFGLKIKSIIIFINKNSPILFLLLLLEPLFFIDIFI